MSLADGRHAAGSAGGGDGSDRGGVLVHCIDNQRLVHFMRRGDTTAGRSFDLDLRGVFRDILERANDFVPSEAGSIFLDDPLVEDGPELVLIACFGAVADRLVGLQLGADTGIAGSVYRRGVPYRSVAPHDDPVFEPGPGAAVGYEVRSIVAAPLSLEGRTVGVLELLNRCHRPAYTEADQALLGIFAQTISASIVNAIAAHRAEETSRRDDLTGLYNDRYLHHRLSQLVRESLAAGRDCGLIFLDLDHFKSVNDHHGHLVGSRVLREVGRTLHQIVPGHAFAARYGGDEFVVVVPDAGRQETTWVAETVRKNIEETVFLEHADAADPVNYPALAIRGVVTCSLGVATLLEDTGGAPTADYDPATAKNELMRAADSNMYRAKAAGRNRIAGGPGDER